MGLQLKILREEGSTLEVRPAWDVIIIALCVGWMTVLIATSCSIPCLVVVMA